MEILLEEGQQQRKNKQVYPVIDPTARHHTGWHNEVNDGEYGKNQ